MSNFPFRSAGFVITIFCASALALAQRTLTVFDAPDATSGTFPSKINSAGLIVGSYLTTANHGFLRNPDSSIVEFDAPNVTDTIPTSVNGKGQIVGFAASALNGAPRGFLRSASGRFSLIIYPGAYETWAYSINDGGAIVGIYANLGSSVSHGFVRDASGVFIAVDVPGAGTDSNQGTYLRAVNNTGQSAGEYWDSLNGVHGFIRDADGNITTFDAPESTHTSPYALNDNGDVTGFYTTSLGKSAGFIRHADGTFATFSTAGISTIFIDAINNSGSVCGVVYVEGTVQRGFVRDPSGNMLLTSGPQPNSGGWCIDINDNLRATGRYVGSNGLTHGWVR